jgi:hypothetical protein
VAPDEPGTDQGFTLLNFATYDETQEAGASFVGGNFDVNLINNVFIDNDYSFENDFAVSSF